MKPRIVLFLLAFLYALAFVLAAQVGLGLAQDQPGKNVSPPNETPGPVQVRVNLAMTTKSFVVPGSRVDIIATVRRGNERESFSMVLLENVTVLALHDNLVRDNQGRALLGCNVTLALSPKDALKVSSFPAHWDPKLRIPRGQVVAAASIVSPKY